MSTTTEAALLAQIAAAPDDDAPRAVLADLLLARQDPRGELIALQLERARGLTGDPAREATLLAAHQAQWLAGLADMIVLEGIVFARGFLDRCVVRGQAVDRLTQTAGDPRWATVREIECDGWHSGGTEAMAAVLTHPVARALRKVTGIGSRVFDALATGPTPLPIEEISVAWLDLVGHPGRVVEALAIAPALPALRRLDVRRLHVAQEERGWLDFFWTGALARRLEVFSFASSFPKVWIQHLAALGATQPRCVRIGERELIATGYGFRTR